MMERMIAKQYDKTVCNITQVFGGVGGLTYAVETCDGKYILKGTSDNRAGMQNEPEISEFLKTKQIPVAEYIKTNDGHYVWEWDSISYHLQRFVEGETLPFHAAPDWFMTQSGSMLGRIHSALSTFRPLPIGLGEGFLNFMTPDHPKRSYERTLERAIRNGDGDIAKDVAYRLSQIDSLQKIKFDIVKFTCCNTHGDYKISQMLCKGHQISAVIDWTSACIHPVCWEIIRSFTYADPSSRDGEIEFGRFLKYINAYLDFSPLNPYDLNMMPSFFCYQLLACDYYGQYYDAEHANKADFLHQATFATKLIRWLQKNMEELSEMLIKII